MPTSSTGCPTVPFPLDYTKRTTASELKNVAMMSVQENLIWLEQGAAPAIKGNLDQIHPARLVYGFFKARKTGLLVVADGVLKVRLYLCDGVLFPYRKGIFSEPEFVRFLQGQNLITEDERLSYQKIARDEKTGVVELMIKRRVIDADLAGKAADLFFRKNVNGLFSWRHGGYAFHEVGLPEVEEKPDPAQMLRWIVAGVREKYNPAMIEQRLERRLRTPLRLAGALPVPLEELLQNKAERQVGEMIGEGASLDRIMNESTLGATDARALVFALLTIECCKFKSGIKRPDSPARERATVARPLLRLFRAAEASVDRIHREVVREEAQPAPRAGEVELAIAEPESEESLRRELIERLQKFAEERQSRRSGDAETRAAAANHAAAAEAAAERFPDPEKHEEDIEAVLGDQPPAGDTADADELASPDEVDAIIGDEDEVKLADLDEPASPKSDEFFANLEATGGGEALLDSSREMLFSAEDPPDQINQLGISLLEQGLWAKAREMFELAVSRGFPDPSAKARLGYALYHEISHESDRFAQAAAWIQKAITQNPKDATGYLYMGQLYQAEGDLSMAELYYVRAVEVDRECVEAKELIRQLHQERKK